MAFLVLRDTDIERLLPMRTCIDVMARALRDLATGDLVQPLRSGYEPVPSSVVVWMPAYRTGGDAPVYGIKQLCVVHDNASRGLDTHQGAVLLLDGTTGRLRALLDATTITAIRTAAVSAVATRLLARDDAETLAIIGTGTQGVRHLESIPLVRPIKRVRIAGRKPERARDMVARYHGPLQVEAVDSVEQAVRGADVVVTATPGVLPILPPGWLAPGTHINAVGASVPPLRELHAETMAGCALFTDRRQSLDAEAAEWIDGRARGLFGPEHVRAELGEVLAGTRPGRLSATEITLFRSLGLASEDLAAAEAVVDAARAAGVGTEVEF